jgi:hypothetical protein
MQKYQLPSNGSQTYISENDLYKKRFRHPNEKYILSSTKQRYQFKKTRKNKKKKMSRSSREGSVLCDPADRRQAVTSRGPYNAQPDVNWAVKAWSGLEPQIGRAHV